MSNMSDRRIVVTGLGLICALGDGTDKCWSAASNGITGIREVQSVSTEGCRQRCGFLQTLPYHEAPPIYDAVDLLTLLSKYYRVNTKKRQ